MTRAPAHLQLMKQADDVVDATEAAAAEQPSLTPIVTSGPDDGRLAHPATRRRGTPAPSLHDTEGRLVGFVADLLEAPEGATGIVTAGVAEAAIAVMRGARDSRPHLKLASVVLPHSAHPAYFAAAATTGLVPIVVPVDVEGRAPLGAMTSAIREDTVLVVASAPSYTHGAVDPIGWIAAATTARGVPLHVDATNGGWAMAYAERAGRVRPSWTFSVGGVGSIAVDVGPESGGAADLTVVLHRDEVGARSFTAATLARGPLDLATTWTRPGALLADVVETLHEVGHEGCSQLATAALDATAAIVDGTIEQRGVQLAARPDATTLTLRADTTCDVFTVADGLQQRGWTSHPVLPEVGPPLLRLPVTAAMLPVVDELLVALHDSIAEAQLRGRARVDATLERLLERLDPEDVSDYSAHLLLDAATTLDAADAVDAVDAVDVVVAVDDERSGRRAATNLLLAAAQPGVRETLVAVHQQRQVRPVRPGRGQPASDSTDASE